MAKTRNKKKPRRVAPEKSGLADKNGRTRPIPYDRILPMLAIAVIALLVMFAVANYGALTASGSEGASGVRRLLGSSALLTFLAVFYGLYLSLFQKSVVKNWHRLMPHLILAVVPIVAGKVLTVFGNEMFVYYTPMAMTAMIFAVAYRGRTSSFLSLLLCMMAAVSLLTPAGRFRFDLLIMLIGGSLTAALLTGRIRRSSRPLKIGFAAGVVQAILILSTRAVTSADFEPADVLPVVFVAGMNGLVSGVLVLMLMSLGVIEYAFRVTTDLTLLELSDQNHRLLRRLAIEAPGTYHHSQVLGGLAEAAGEAIGANSLLLRVGAYFHDAGKINKPEYFAENETGGTSLHARLSPAMSTLIISAHTKDGSEIARDHGLPKPIIDLIKQHHGTSLIEFFHRKAVDEQGGKAGVKEEFFRHPGPKPRSREAGILMLADAVESASRALSHPTPSRIERQVHDIVSRKLFDGQLDESRLTFAEVHRIEKSLAKGLTHIFHGRVKYPKAPGKQTQPPRTASESYDPLPLG